MTCKQIVFTIPENTLVPDIIQSFSAKENAMMIQIGCNCILDAREHFKSFSQEEIYEQMKNDNTIMVRQLELDMLVQKELLKQFQNAEKDRIETLVQQQIHIYKEKDIQLNQKYDKLQETLLLVKEELRMTELEKNTIIQQEISKEREKFDLLNKEKDRQLTRLNDNYDKIAHKTSTLKGAEGERAFSEIVNTFKDFKGFEIVDKTKLSGEGDFYLKFDEFDILADAKNYKKNVPSSEREKIKMDLMKNNHIHFAWLVSLNTTIDKFDKSPIMFEWVNSNKCIIYINQLLHYENPAQILRIAWFTCRELFKLVNEDDTSDLASLKEKQFKMKDQIKNIRKIIRELNTTIGLFKKQVETVDYELKDLLDFETTELVESNFSVFDDWWKNNIDFVNHSEQKIKSTDIWFRFKQENKDIVKQLNITTDKFKQYVKSILPMTSYDIRSNHGAFEIKGVVWK